MSSLSLKTRLLTGTAGLVVGFIAVALMVLTTLIDDYAQTQVTADLEAGRDSYTRFLAERRRKLREQVLTLSEAPSLKAALAIPGVDRSTLEATVQTLRHTAPTALLLVGDADARLAAGLPPAPALRRNPLGRPGLAAALAGQSSDHLWSLNGDCYLTAVAPVQAGELVLGWIAVGERIDAAFAFAVREVTGRDVVVMSGGRRVAESWRQTDEKRISDAQLQRLLAADGDGQPAERRQLQVEGHLVLGMPLHPSGGTLALLRSTAEITGLHDRARALIILAGLAVGALGMLVSLRIAAALARPLRELIRASDALADGDLTAHVAVHTDDEVGRLAHSFNAMARRIEKLVRHVRTAAIEAEQANRAKDRFLASMSHELRTPLTSIQAYAEILLSYGTEASPLEQREFLTVIQGECQRLTKLFDNVLDFVTLTTAQTDWKLDRFDVGTLARAVVDAMARLLEEKHVDFRVVAEAAPYVGDRERIGQVLTCLASNAWKFSPAGEEVRIDVHRTDAGVEIRVADRGPGITGTDAKEAVFAMFYQQGDVLTEKPPGTGLGLAIAKEIVQVHGGTICAQDHRGGGTVFLVHLPDGSTAAARPIDQLVAERAAAFSLAASAAPAGTEAASPAAAAAAPSAEPPAPGERATAQEPRLAAEPKTAGDGPAPATPPEADAPTAKRLRGRAR